MITKIKSVIPKPIKTFKREIVWHYNNIRPPIYGNEEKDLFLGPWLGDVGKELYHWIPYLRRLKADGRLRYKNIYAVSRGGVENWYSGIADGYVEILDYFDSEFYSEPFFRSHKRHLGKKVPKKTNFGNDGQNQWRISPIEKKLIENYANQNNIKNYEIFHPSNMWHNTRRFQVHWKNQALCLQEISKTSLFEKFEMVTQKYSDIVDRLDLPDDYIAAKFYFHPTNLLETDENKKYINQYIEKLSNKKKIVDLSAPISVDEVKPYLAGEGNPNVFRVPSISCENINLGVQTELIKRSQGFVGTLGGLSLLPALLGKPHLAFFSGQIQDIHPNYCYEMMLFSYVYEELHGLPFKSTDIRRVNLLGNLFPDI